ncbi:MAG: Two-component response regulator in acetoacetate metabolism [Clostridiales bacterium 38_11]|nr:MAG: Two-component response regulator in acetoacetate metabolism [Clostridiales bacterium 38_11]HBH12570.1 sigma-54-dependent Fis family transcriptional regulator [Clostridiales bacterium]
MKKNLLIIDDEKAICSSLTFALEDQYNVESTTDPKEGLKKMLTKNYHVVLLDLKIGKVDGIDVLQDIKNMRKSTQVIIMTAFGSIMSSVEAIKKGAFTYLTKPLDLNDLEKAIEQALEYQKLNEKIDCDHKDMIDGEIYHGIIGKSPAMKEIFGLIEKLKDVDTSVVVVGESGTGKELVARAIHYAGKRKVGNFVALNCAAIPETLLEEELFGHKKGTFTGAIADKKGKFNHANNGTIFLDEIGDMSIHLQAKLLRVLQEREFTPLGANDPIALDVRFIAASNRDLRKMVDDGKFREDLYFRLNVFEIDLPPLRQRKQDMPLLFQHFISVFNKSLSKHVTGFSKEAEVLMVDYDYPGNVRELINILEYSVLLTSSNIIEIDDLPSKVKNIASRDNSELDLGIGMSLGIDNLAGLTLQEAEKKLIEAALTLNKGHRKATAAMLGISERGLRNKINEYEIR